VRDKLVAACQKCLKGHDGVDKVAHDNYQTVERHKQFVKENNRNWAKVRVFDSAIAAEKK